MIPPIKPLGEMPSVTQFRRRRPFIQKPRYFARKHTNYIQHTYWIRRHFGFPFSCLTFRDRFR